MNIVVIGPPGSGKTTQAKLISKNYKLKHVYIGDLLRQESKKKTTRGKFIKSLIDKGHFVPSKIAIDLLKDNAKNNFVLDGYPRTYKEAEDLLKLRKIDFVFNIKILKLAIIRRLKKRYKIKKRKDDTPKIIKERIKIHKIKTKPILKLYKEKKILINIDGNKTPVQVFNQIFKSLK